MRFDFANLGTGRFALAGAAVLLSCASGSGGDAAHGRCPALEAVGATSLGDAATQAAAWDAFVAGLADPSADPVARLEARRQSHGLPLFLWAGDELSGEPGVSVAVWLDHPCAATVSLFAKRVPSTIHARLYAGDVVLEVNSVGRETGGWKIPVDARVAAIHGGEILVPYRVASLCASPPPGGEPMEVALAIRRDGRYRVVAAPTAPEPEPFECPELPAFEGSDFLRCAVYRDLDDGAPRRLVYQAPCS